MKRSLPICALAFASLLHAQERSIPSTPSTTPNIVTVSFNAAVLQTAEAQSQITALQTKFAPRQTQLKALSEEIESLRKQLQASADKLSDAEGASRQQALSVKEKQLQRQAEDLRNDSDSDSQQVFQTVAQKVYAFLQTYAQQHSYAMVVERGSDAAPVVWYAAANLDITADLIKAYNAQAGSAAPASESKSAPAKPTSSTGSPKPR
jgi:outer membrane protein